MAYSKLKKGIRCKVRLRLPKDARFVGGQLAGLLGEETVDIAANEPVHRELAILPNDYVLGFVKRWGRVTAGKLGTLRQPGAIFISDVVQALRAAHPESEAEWDKPILFSERPLEILSLRDTLRKAWEGDPAALDFLYRTVKEISSTWSFARDHIAITAENAWAAACLMFLLDHGAKKTAICKNPECQTRYFIKGRSNQKFCESPACVAYAKRLGTMKWWNAYGNKWRAQRRKQSKTKGRKQK
jgi:hypothetical protein